MTDFQPRTPNPSPRSPQAKAGQAARHVAFLLLTEILHRHRALDDALEHSTELAALPARDRAFARLLLTTTLRRLGQIDALLRKYLRQMVKPKDLAAFELMRLGTAQLLFLKTPAHAAIDGTVGLAGRVGVAHLKGLLNAVLRRVDAEGPTDVTKQEAAKLNLPDWLRKSWERSYGRDTTRAIAQALMEEPALDITTKGDPGVWTVPLEAVLLPTGTLRRPLGGSVTDLPGFDQGAWWIQDAAAAIPARLLGEITGKRVVDLCAAPGGKTAQLCAAGATVVAVDRSESRLKRLKSNLARLGLSAEIIVADAAAWTTDDRFDTVLLDAPCSASGTIRRHPDIPHLKGPEDLERLTQLQDRLLAAAVDLLLPGGLLVYCTCSLEAEEGPMRIAKLLAERPELARVPIRENEVGGRSEFLTPEGDLRTLPSHLPELGGIDGFFAARLVRLP